MTKRVCEPTDIACTSHSLGGRIEKNSIQFQSLYYNEERAELFYGLPSELFKLDVFHPEVFTEYIGLLSPLLYNIGIFIVFHSTYCKRWGSHNALFIICTDLCLEGLMMTP
jgi:hypothetical protein